ncbi:MAG: hypothetical protein KDC48_17320 [Planctomycetes bacterium]|nr:hypothetical protein [Planctomycetota bacterium]
MKSPSRRPTFAPSSLLVALPLCLLGACAGSPTSSPPPSRPQPQTAPVAPPAQPVVPTAPDLAPVPPTATANASTGALLTNHGNGVTAIALPGQREGQSVVQVFVRAGADEARPGVAELAAETLVASSDASSGRRSLRQRVGELGGTLDVDVGPTGIWITARTPARSWQDVATAMLAAMRDPAESRPQIERLRDEYLDARGREIWSAPEAGAARAMMLGDAGTSAYVANLLDRDASEVRQFLAVQCVPARTILSVETDADTAAVQRALDALVTAANWRGSPVQAAAPAQPRPQRSGIYWAPSDGNGLASASLVIPVPDAADPRSADALVLLACLTLDGIGGRLERRLRERGLGHLQFRSQWQHAGLCSSLVLTTRCTPTEAKVLWQAYDEARQSLRATPPNASELELGLRRATLATRLRNASDAARLRERVGAVLRPATDPSVEQRLGELARSGGGDARTAIDAFLDLPTAMVVFGGQPPETLTAVTQFELLPPGALAKLVGAPVQAQAAAAFPWLAPSLEAIGGAELLRRTIGCRATLARRVGGVAATSETLEYRAPDQLSRRREILGSTIATDLTAKGASEALEATRVSLDSVETRRILREQARHPISLLAAYARGEIQFRPIAQRDIGGREVLVLEALGGGFERLRIHVDATSRLVRVVEVWETLESGLRAHVQESWSDYRSAGGLRAPFRCVTEIDDGSSRTETVYSSWEPLSRGP